MTRLYRFRGRVLRVELLPRPLAPAARWDGTDQARPATMAAKVGRGFNLMARALSDAFNGRDRA